MICSLGSHLSSGMNHQLKIAKMVIAPKITPAYHKDDKRISDLEADSVCKPTHKVERLSSDREEERRNLGRKHDSVEKRRRDVKVLGKPSQPEF